MLVKEVLDRTVQFFKDKKLDSPRLDAELLIAKALGYRRIDLYLKFDQPLKDDELGRCRDLVKRRSQGEPVAYILGEKDFFGLTFRVDSRVLIPRPETELLAEAALEFLKKRELEESDAAEETEILDLGCGSGCLGLSIASRAQHVKATFVDLSPDALEVAKANAEQLGISDRCAWIQSEAEKVDLGGRAFDLIVANPPYISHGDPRVQPDVAKFEPSMALYADADGFAAIEAWAKHTLKNLKPGGFMGFEFGIDQADRARKLFESLSLVDVKIIEDLSGFPRHVTGKKGSANG